MTTDKHYLGEALPSSSSSSSTRAEASLLFLGASGTLSPHINHLIRDNAGDSCRWLSVYYVPGSLLKTFPTLSFLILQPPGR